MNLHDAVHAQDMSINRSQQIQERSQSMKCKAHGFTNCRNGNCRRILDEMVSEWLRDILINACLQRIQLKWTGIAALTFIRDYSGVCRRIVREAGTFDRRKHP